MKAQKLWRSSLLIAALFPAGVIAACSAKVGGGDPTFTGGTTGGPVGGMPTSMNPATGSGSGGPSPTGGNSPAAPVAITPAMAPPESAGQLMMRRVTFSEYDHMLADLLGDTSAPAEDPSHQWGADALNTDGFTTPNSTPDQLVINFNSAADTVVETALTAGKLPIPCTNPTAAQESACVTNFITTFGLRAYRRPVAAAEQTDLMTLFTTVRGMGVSFTESVAAVAKGMLQSPNFLYHWEIGPTKPVVDTATGLVPLTQWQIASRLAESLWNSTPDTTLLTAAQNGQLGTPALVLAQAQRMIADPKAAQALNDFHQQWLLNVGTRTPNLDGIRLAGPLTQAAVDGLTTEWTSFIASVYSSGDGTLKSFLTAPYAYVNHDLATIYGVAGPAAGSTTFMKIALDPTKRGGLFTQVAFLASFAAGQTDNPVFRGLSIYTKLLCGTTKPPPPTIPGVNFVNTGTTRQSYETHANQACAQGCHTLFDPPGFAFENYDGVGLYRTTENGQQVDSTGSFVTPGGATITFTNAIDLMTKLSSNSEVQACIDRQWTRYILGRTETAAEAGSLDLALQKGSATPGFSMRDMLTSFVSSKAFMYRTLSPGETL